MNFLPIFESQTAEECGSWWWGWISCPSPRIPLAPASANWGFCTAHNEGKIQASQGQFFNFWNKIFYQQYPIRTISEPRGCSLSVTREKQQHQKRNNSFPFHQIRPLGRFDLVVAMLQCPFICLLLSPFHVILPGEHRRSQESKAVPPPRHWYPEKMYIKKCTSLKLAISPPLLPPPPPPPGG